MTIKEILVYDMLGKKIEVKIDSISTVDVSQLSKGLYIIKLINDVDQVFTSKFVKE